jgi:hypothetical protein
MVSRVVTFRLSEIWKMGFGKRVTISIDHRFLYVRVPIRVPKVFILFRPNEVLRAERNHHTRLESTDGFKRCFQKSKSDNGGILTIIL